MSSQASRSGLPVRYRFSDFLLCPQQAALWKAGVRVPLMPKPLATLIVLVQHAGKTVSKEELLSAVWGGLAVEENNLTQCISTLRKALGEKRGENRFIATEPGTGYRFVAPVVTAIAEQPAETLTLPAQPQATRRRTMALLASATACLYIAAALSSGTIATSQTEPPATVPWPFLKSETYRGTHRKDGLRWRCPRC